MNPPVLLNGAQGKTVAGNIKSVISLFRSLFSRISVELISNGSILKIKDLYLNNLVVTFVCA